MVSDTALETYTLRVFGANTAVVSPYTIEINEEAPEECGVTPSCAGDELCIEGRCLVSTGASCTEDFDCLADLTCVGNACVFPEGFCDDPYESNDDLMSAVTITLPADLQNTTLCLDEDFYALSLEAGQMVNVVLTFQDSDEVDIDLSALDPMGDELESSMSTSSREELIFSVEETGTYYVRVYPYLLQTEEFPEFGTRYTLSINITQEN